MAMQERSPGNAHEKRNCWQRGNGPYSMRGELRRGISANTGACAKPYIWWSFHRLP